MPSKTTGTRRIGPLRHDPGTAVPPAFLSPDRLLAPPVGPHGLPFDPSCSYGRRHHGAASKSSTTLEAPALLVLPSDYNAAPPSDKEQVTVFCGICQHFEAFPLGGGGECHKGHDPEERTRAQYCPDRTPMPVSQGPQFDMSE